mmetsp:Transcript_51881/g.151040  ORF Transcript_51881/g.151040 Transcript_51881/m.151040 type:complete len:216 (+) Transcript_51881:3174-3821(+)
MCLGGVLGGRADAHQQRCLAIPSDGAIQDPGELALAKRHVHPLGCQCTDDVAEHMQAPVDGQRFFQLGSFDTALFDPLGPRQVHNAQSRTSAFHLLRCIAVDGSRGPWVSGDPYLEDGMAPARRLIQLCLCVHQIRSGAVECVQQGLRLVTPDPSEAWHNASILHGQPEAVARISPCVQEVVHLLIVHLHGRCFDLVRIQDVARDLHKQARHDAR